MPYAGPPWTLTGFLWKQLSARTATSSLQRNLFRNNLFCFSGYWDIEQKWPNPWTSVSILVQSLITHPYCCWLILVRPWTQWVLGQNPHAYQGCGAWRGSCNALLDLVLCPHRWLTPACSCHAQVKLTGWASARQHHSLTGLTSASQECQECCCSDTTYFPCKEERLGIIICHPVLPGVCN